MIFSQAQWGDYPGLSLSHVIIRILIRGKQVRVGEEDVMMEAEVEVDVSTIQRMWEVSRS